MQTYSLQTPLQDQDILKLRVGDAVLLSGVIYTARDAAHKRIVEALTRGSSKPWTGGRNRLSPCRER